MYIGPYSFSPMYLFTPQMFFLVPAHAPYYELRIQIWKNAFASGLQEAEGVQSFVEREPRKQVFKLFK